MTPRFRVTIDEDHINDAGQIRSVWNHSFVLTLSPALRMGKVGHLPGVAPNGGGRVDASSWASTQTWTERWLRCEEGIPSQRSLDVEHSLAMSPDPDYRLPWVIEGLRLWLGEDRQGPNIPEEGELDDEFPQDIALARAG